MGGDVLGFHKFGPFLRPAKEAEAAVVSGPHLHPEQVPLAIVGRRIATVVNGERRECGLGLGERQEDEEVSVGIDDDGGLDHGYLIGSNRGMGDTEVRIHR